MKALLALTLLVIGLGQIVQAKEFIGVYTATTDYGVNYKIIFSKSSENENTLMEVIQVKPHIRQTAPIYELNPQGAIHSSFKYGDLILVNEGSRNNHFFSYKEEINKKENITLIDNKGEEIRFYKDDNFSPPKCRGPRTPWQDEQGVWHCLGSHH